MRIRYERGDGDSEVSFRAENEQEQRDLKTAIFEAARHGLALPSLLKALESLGYDFAHPERVSEQEIHADSR